MSLHSERTVTSVTASTKYLFLITKRASMHTLRHAYATHHLESGTDLVYLKKQLGHKLLKTTERYIHLCKTGWSKLCYDQRS